MCFSLPKHLSVIVALVYGRMLFQEFGIVLVLLKEQFYDDFFIEISIYSYISNVIVTY